MCLLHTVVIRIPLPHESSKKRDMKHLNSGIYPMYSVTVLRYFRLAFLLDYPTHGILSKKVKNNALDPWKNPDET